jgi:hypothetical protein
MRRAALALLALLVAPAGAAEPLAVLPPAPGAGHAIADPGRDPGDSRVTAAGELPLTDHRTAYYF